MSSSSLFATLVDWFQHPFRSDGSALNWLLFIGLLIIAAWMWNTVLRNVVE